MVEVLSLQSPFQILVSPFAGRTYHSTRALLKGECILDVSTPYACTIYKQFRSEVCAECWKYDGGRRTFLTSREFGETAGLMFCDDRCKQHWLSREGEEMVVLLVELEGARRRKANGRDDTRAPERSTTVREIKEEHISQAWDLVRQQSTQAKSLKQWKNIQLDEFQADMARYVLVSVYHYARELQAQSDSLHGEGSFASAQCHSRGPVRFGMASWHDFAALQSGELNQVRKFPELLSDHIKIYKVLKSRFNSRTIISPTLTTLGELLTTENVRTSLAVDPGNSFGIWEIPVTEESEGLGFGVYPIPSFFNHRECIVRYRVEMSFEQHRGI